ncbi:7-carboxy-7-deazaguanine synthase QueE, partial [Candidatus Peregrinibacteria bacterium]|nr:7-carboxy-7-deazaguanine synthase QueE [Candidatus Peregrinibacteria bacterium]
YFVEIETSGSLIPQINDLINQYNCSPKLSNSKNRPINYQASLPKFPKEKTWFKFVVDSKSDLKEIKKFIKDHKLTQEKIILMPQGISHKEIAKKSPWLAEICKKENWRYSTRLHIELWGNKRGI